MVKKTKSTSPRPEHDVSAAGIRESAQQIWMAGLGAFAKAQAGGNKVFEALMKEGGALQSRTRSAARDQVDDMAAKASGTWDKLEQVFEKRVAQTLHTLGVPTHEDIDTLSRRVAELSALVTAMQKAPARQAKDVKVAATKRAAAAPAVPAAPSKAAAAPAKKSRKPAVKTKAKAG